MSQEDEDRLCLKEYAMKGRMVTFRKMGKRRRNNTWVVKIWLLISIIH